MKIILTINQTFFSKTFDNLKYHSSPSGSISILNESANKNSSVIFYLVKSAGIYNGLALDMTNDKGYQITSTDKGILQFKEKSKNQLLFVCEGTIPTEIEEEEFIMNYIGNSKRTSSVLTLESKPGATKLIYLDFDGESNLIGWTNKIYFTSNISNRVIKSAWESVSEDFLSFDVNVTTNRALFDATPIADKGWVVFANFKNNKWIGLAHLNSFGTGEPVLVDCGPKPPLSKVLFMAAAHEVGHSLGLSHDGKGLAPYYGGHGEYTPIMGNGNKDVSHWSKGEYAGATNKEDDIAIIGASLGIRADDQTTAQPLVISFNDSVHVQSNFGTIESRADVDEFTFETTAQGQTKIAFFSTTLYSNLDILIKLYKEDGTLITSSNPGTQRWVLIDENLAAGKYKITIEGDGELTVNTGFSDYGSYGYYQIQGLIKNHKKEANDIAIIATAGKTNICEKVYTPKIIVSNNGLNVINSFTVDIFIDGTLDHSETINKTLTSGISETITLNDISTYGSHTMKYVLALPTNETILYNNELTSSYVLKDGNLVTFSTDFMAFNGKSPLSWEILDANNTTIASSTILATYTIGSKRTQLECIADGCYDFVLTGLFNTCSNFPIYNNNNQYSSGSQVVYDGILWKADWDPTKGEAPGVNQWGAWKKTGITCTGSFSYTLNDAYYPQDVLTNTSGGFTSGAKENFCINVITANDEFSEKENFDIYPNPSNGSFTIISPVSSGYLEILNSLGQTIQTRSFINTNIQINQDLNSGVYFVKIHSDEKISVAKIIVR